MNLELNLDTIYAKTFGLIECSQIFNRVEKWLRSKTNFKGNYIKSIKKKKERKKERKRKTRRVSSVSNSNLFYKTEG